MNIDLAALFGIGVMTLATPCVLPLLPIYLGMLLGSGLEAAREPGGRFRLFSATLAFSAGFTLIFTILGLGASTVGSFLQAHRTALTMVGAIIIVIFGLKFLGLFRIPWLDRELRLPEVRTGRRLVDAFAFGTVFALGWTPCVGPLLGSVLTYTASRSADPLTGALYLGTYSIGVATPLVALGLFADRLLPLLDRLNRHLGVIEKVTGAALVLFGLGLSLSVVSPSLLGGSHDGSSEEGPVARFDDSDRFIEPELGFPSPIPRVVEFYRPDCQACERARSRVESLRSDCMGRRIEILAVNIDDPRNRSIARSFSISMVPTFILIDTEGDEQGRMIGAPDLQELRGAAALLMAETCAGVDATRSGELPVDGAGCPGASPGPGTDEQDLPPLFVDEETCQG